MRTSLESKNSLLCTSSHEVRCKHWSNKGKCQYFQCWRTLKFVREQKKICSCVCTVIYCGSEMCFEPCYFYFIKKILENRYFYKNKRRAGAYFCAKIIPLFDILCHVIAWFTTSSNSGKKFSPYFSQCLNNQQFL